MSRRRRERNEAHRLSAAWAPSLALMAALIVLVSTGAGVAWAAFSARTTNDANTFSAAASFATVTDSAVATATSCTPGAVRQGGRYYVYANVTRGPSAVTADVSAISAGQTAVAMAEGSFSVGGTKYNRRSAELTATAVLSEGAKTYTVTPVGGTPQSGTVIVDNTAPRGAAIDTANGGSTVGRIEQGDSITFTYSERMDSCSILAGWTGAPFNLVVFMQQNAADDQVYLLNAAGQLLDVRLGGIGWQGDLVDTDTRYGQTGTPTTLTQSGAAVTVRFGTQTGTSRQTAAADFLWAPSSASKDPAGNAASTATVRETGPLDQDF